MGRSSVLSDHMTTCLSASPLLRPPGPTGRIGPSHPPLHLETTTCSAAWLSKPQTHFLVLRSRQASIGAPDTHPNDHASRYYRTTSDHATKPGLCARWRGYIRRRFFWMVHEHPAYVSASATSSLHAVKCFIPSTVSLDVCMSSERRAFLFLLLPFIVVRSSKEQPESILKNLKVAEHFVSVFLSVALLV